MKPKHQIIAVVALVLVIIGGFSLYAALPLLGSNDVVLKTRQVDPFDPLRGQYLVIAYDAGNVEVIPDVEEGDTVYVKLLEKEGIWEPVGAQTAKPSESFIRGEVNRISGGRMTVRFGIEQYFFERNAEFNATNLTVHAKIDDSGQARIVELLNNGKPLEMDYLVRD